MGLLFWGRCSGRILSSSTLFLLLGFASSTQADTFIPNNITPTQTFATLADAETAMRAVSAGAAALQFDHLSGSGINAYRYYAVPPLPPIQPGWSDCANVPGFHGSGQAVCDARRAWINSPNPLIYTPDLNAPQDGFGYLGRCLEGGNALGYPQRWLGCPSGYDLVNITTFAGVCDGGVVGWGPSASCQNFTTAMITVVAGCPVGELTPYGPPDPYPLDIVNLTQRAKDAINCLASCSGQSLTVFLSSAYRTVAYQKHFREVWDKWGILKDNENPACAALKAQVKNEFYTIHQLDKSTKRPAAGGGCHPTGGCFDVNGWFTGTVDFCSTQCDVYRPWPGQDPFHTLPY